MSEERDQGQKFGELTGELKLLTSAIGNLTSEFRDFKNGIGPRLQGHDTEIATLIADRKNDIQYLNAVDSKVDRWVGVSITAIVGLAGWILKALHFSK